VQHEVLLEGRADPQGQDQPSQDHHVDVPQGAVDVHPARGSPGGIQAGQPGLHGGPARLHVLHEAPLVEARGLLPAEGAHLPDLPLPARIPGQGGQVDVEELPHAPGDAPVEHHDRRLPVHPPDVGGQAPVDPLGLPEPGEEHEGADPGHERLRGQPELGGGAGAGGAGLLELRAEVGCQLLAHRFHGRLGAEALKSAGDALHAEPEAVALHERLRVAEVEAQRVGDLSGELRQGRAACLAVSDEPAVGLVRLAQLRVLQREPVEGHGHCQELPERVQHWARAGFLEVAEGAALLGGLVRAHADGMESHQLPHEVLGGLGHTDHQPPGAAQRGQDLGELY